MQLKLPLASRPARQAFVAVFELHLGEAPITAAEFLNTSCLGQAVIMQQPQICEVLTFNPADRATWLSPCYQSITLRTDALRTPFTEIVVEG